MKLSKIAVLGSLLFTVACQTTQPVPPAMYHDQQKYLTYNKHKSMVGAIGSGGAYTYGWAWGHSSIDTAIEDAKRRCELGRSSNSIHQKCTIHFIGNQNVRSLSKDELKIAIDNYKAGLTKIFPENWHQSISGVYQGSLLNNDMTSSVTTTLTKTTENKVIGSYQFDDAGKIEQGNLINCHPNKYGQLSCEWQDSYGAGIMKVKFNDSLDQFEGEWGIEKIDPLFYWTGKKDK
ncbi:hypothetical protein [Kiloniella sp. EL199]|uniref:hypothetical protein n=1 Tax=Kiloniella sp. EL199 TaxID=2107581 RepID=UPI000EA21905|nr:hypothetical protein [Kiloniella sp. EL199]